MGHPCGALLLKFPNFSKVNRHVYKTRVSYDTPPRVTRQVYKTSISHETSSKIHLSLVMLSPQMQGGAHASFARHSAFDSRRET